LSFLQTCQAERQTVQNFGEPNQATQESKQGQGKIHRTILSWLQRTLGPTALRNQNEAKFGTVLR
jgi:hypothetical protein